MASIETTRNSPDTLATEEERVFSWRHATLLAAGYDPRHAFKLALRSDVDLHLAVRMRKNGCPPETAVRILA
jgi:hypothetical protein